MHGQALCASWVRSTQETEGGSPQTPSFVLANIQYLVCEGTHVLSETHRRTMNRCTAPALQQSSQRASYLLKACQPSKTERAKS